MTDIPALKAANTHRWQVANIAPKRQAEVGAVADRLQHQPPRSTIRPLKRLPAYHGLWWP
jgi:hypothetical protein